MLCPSQIIQVQVYAFTHAGVFFMCNYMNVCTTAWDKGSLSLKDLTVIYQLSFVPLFVVVFKCEILTVIFTDIQVKKKMNLPVLFGGQTI